MEGVCLLCGAPQPQLIAGYETFRRVTSDCKPWPAGGQLCVCRSCKGVQAVTDSNWWEDVGRIYADYSIYYQSSGGSEQMVFDSSGRGLERSARILARLGELGLLADTGRALDIGSGNGALLRALAAIRPRWSLVASDVGDRFRDVVESIPNVEQLHTCPPKEIPGTFDLVALIHALEHAPSPVELLASVRGKLAPDGLLLVQVPDATQNPFDLLVADHSVHFSAAVLKRAVQRAGYEVESLRTDWVAKELSLLARTAASKPNHQNLGYAPPEMSAAAVVQQLDVVQQLEWLRAVADHARRCHSQQPLGIFGTSIAGAWLFGELGGAVRFFVDEDPARVGGTYMGLPIYHPLAVPAGSHVFIGLAPGVAEQVAFRFRGNGAFTFTTHLPSGMPRESIGVESP